MSDSTRSEEFRVNGDQVVGKVKELVNEGNVRRITLKTEDGKTLIEVPLTVGVIGLGVGVVFAPVLAAIAVIAALVTKVNIVVERVDTTPPAPTKTVDATETTTTKSV